MAQSEMSGQEAQLNVETPEEFQIRVDFPEIPTQPIVTPEGDVDDADVEFGLLDQLTGGGTLQARVEERSKNAILAAMATIKEMAMQTDAMRKGIPGGSQPRMIKIKFGVNLDFEAGAMIARSGVGATMEIELEWARRSDDVLRVLRAETDVDDVLFRDAEKLDQGA